MESAVYLFTQNWPANSTLRLQHNEYVMRKIIQKRYIETEYREEESTNIGKACEAEARLTKKTKLTDRMKK